MVYYRLRELTGGNRCSLVSPAALNSSFQLLAWMLKVLGFMIWTLRVRVCFMGCSREGLSSCKPKGRPHSELHIWLGLKRRFSLLASVQPPLGNF